MKNPEKIPDVGLTMLFSMLPFMGVGIIALVSLIQAYNAHVVLDYICAGWGLGICYFVLIILIARLSGIAMEYIWHYRALVHYLRKRGLDNFVQEAKKLKCLK